MKRVTCYVDGFNLYHAIDDLTQPHLKWLDLWSLAESLTYPRERLVSVNYFSAFATWLPDKYARHRVYVRALELRGVTTFMARFKEKDRQCYGCGSHWIDHEEKETDVHIALKILADAFDDIFDRAIIISGDSDLVPVLTMVHTRFPTKGLLVAPPPGRYAGARDLRQQASSQMEITKGRIARNLLPAEVSGGDDDPVVTRPREYDPPPPSPP